MASTVMASMSSATFAAGVRSGRVAPVYGLTLRHRLVVRAQAEPDVGPTEETTTTSSRSPSPAAAPRPSSPKPKEAAKPGLWDALAFNGPAPERFNGRLAMVGLVSALTVEAYRGGGLFSQAGSGSGLALIAITAAVLSVASLVP
ncbi:hypothetical protein PR202_ga28187 [Eleusine coracana subsp. coracana]|uniref:Uncharacterized protein n=1 Tax=Eleusine coracana subsp. coracana TaxID=191504 RepID=A0AAV5DGR6_ELECO|nr:hypothetical protein PR202_ga28187 [Eleusine coracana subsp. coracana]